MKSTRYRVAAAVLFVITLYLCFPGAKLGQTEAQQSSLTLEIQGVPSYIYIGQPVTVTLAYANEGDEASGPVVLEVDVPPDFEVTDITEGGKAAYGRIRWSLSDIPPGGGGEVRVTLRGLLPDDHAGARYDDDYYPGHAVFDDGFQLEARLVVVGEVVVRTVAITDTGAIQDCQIFETSASPAGNLPFNSWSLSERVPRGQPSFVSFGLESASKPEAEPTQASANSLQTGDLTMTALTLPASVTPGDTVILSYRVVNQGTAISSNCSWADRFYLSDDAVLDPDDLFIAEGHHFAGLGAGLGYDNDITISFPGAFPGNYFVIGTTDFRNEISEANENNNTRSLAVSVLEVPLLTVNVPRLGNVGEAETRYFRIDGEHGSSLQIRLNQTSANQADIYLRFGAFPDQDFDSSNTLVINPKVLGIPFAAAGTYYVAIRGQPETAMPQAGDPFTITLEQSVLAVLGVSPNQGSNEGSVSVTVLGTNFAPGATVSLFSGGTIRAAESSIFVDSTTLFATFNLVGLSAGAYGVRVGVGGENVSLANAFTVTSGGQQGNVEVTLSVPYSTRPGWSNVVTVTYRNVGDTNALAPILLVSASPPTVGYFRLPNGDRVDNVLMLAISNSGPAGVLPPGATISRSLIWVAQIGGIPKFTASLPAAENETFDWEPLRDPLRPPFVSAAGWDAIFNNFKASIGDTWRDVNEVLARNATHLSGLGIRTDDFERLMAFEFMHAGMGEIAARYAPGSLGFGRHDPAVVTTTEDASGDATILQGGASRTFLRRPDGTYYPANPMDHGALSKLPTFTLLEKDGSSLHFRTDGKLDYFEDANGDRSQMAYDGSGRLFTATYANGDVVTYTYDAASRIATKTDPVGRLTTYTYDANGNLETETDTLGTTTYTSLSGQGAAREHALSSVTLPNGLSMFFDYDNFGRIISQSNNGGAKEFMRTYPQAGQYVETDITEASTQVFLTDFGMPGLVVAPNGLASRHYYDESQNLVRSQVGPGNETFTYDPRRNLTKYTDTIGRIISSSYDPAFNHLTAFVDPRGNATSYVYDANGNLREVDLPGSGPNQLFTYDSRGRLSTMTSRAGDVTIITYNANDKIASKSTNGSPLNFSFDSHRNTTQISDSGGSTTFTYDARDRLERINYPGGRYLEYEYNNANQRTRVTDQTGYSLAYRYDALGRLVGIQDAGGADLVTYTFDTAGRVTLKSMAGGSTTELDYNAFGDLARVTNRANSSIVSEFEYDYDLLGRRITLDTSSGTTRYGYDLHGQLTSVQLPSPRTVSYSYDAAGNRISVTDNAVTTTYLASPLNTYTSVGGSPYTHDVAGRLEARSTTAAWSFSYDAEGRLIQALSPDETTTYEYAQGRLAAVVRDGVRRELVQDPVTGFIFAEYDAAGAVQTRYIAGNELVGLVHPGGTAFYFFDGSANTAQVMSSTGAVLNSYNFLPYGEKLSASESVANRYTFGGQNGALDHHSGLYHMGARHYDPVTGRFITPDPIGLSGGDVNLYRYALNNPVNYGDPSGLKYIDFNLTVPTAGPAALTAGVLIDHHTGGIHLYGGGGAATNAGGSLTFSGESVAEGWNWGLTMSRNGPGGQIGGKAGQTLMDSGFSEVGLASSPGASLTGYYVTGPQNGAQLTTATVATGGGAFAGSSIIGSSAAGPAAAAGFFGYMLGTWADENNFLHSRDLAQGFWSGAFGAWDYMRGTNKHDELVPREVRDAMREADAKNIIVVDSRDPNSIDGPGGPDNPAGTPQENWIKPGVFPYTVHFENVESATAPAQFVEVTQGPLDSDLDYTTFAFGPFGWGELVVTPPPLLQTYSQLIDDTAQSGLYVQVDLSFDSETGLLTATFQSIDPDTGNPPAGALDGFLPPNNADHAGEAFLSYAVTAKSTLLTATAVTALASIVFDTNEPIDTNTHLNLIDVTPPTSSVTSPTGTIPTTTFTVSWSGADPHSGLGTFDIFVAENSGPYTPWLTATTETAASYVGVAGRSYRFYSVATDAVENVEPAPDNADVTVQVQTTTSSGKLEIRKATVPETDPGRFNLRVGAANFGTGANRGNGGSTGEVIVTAGAHQVSETAVTGTNLSSYSSSLSCVLDGSSTVVATGIGPGPHTVNVDADQDVVCIFTNNRLPPTAPVLSLSPGSATNDVGDSHCITATVVDSNGKPLVGAPVVFNVTGTVSASGTVATGSDGKGRFCYKGTSKAGSDTISACVSDPPVCAGATNRWEADDERRPTRTPTPTASPTPVPTSTPAPVPTLTPRAGVNPGAIVGGPRQTPVVVVPPPPPAPTQGVVIRPPNTGDAGFASPR